MVEDYLPVQGVLWPPRRAQPDPSRKKNSLTTKERGNVPRRFSRMYRPRFQPENYSADIHRKLALRMIWLSRPTAVPAELLPPRCPVPKGQENILRKPQRERAL